MESAHSIRFLYRHFLSGITEKSLNAFYYACSYAKVDYSGFMNITASMALNLIPESLRSQPVFLCIDNTVKKLVVCTLKIDYQLTTIDYYILPRFALFCIMYHILQILCEFLKVRKSFQNTANHGILGEKIL